MTSEHDIKRALIDRYDSEARELDTPEWLTDSSDERPPEPGAGHYFVKRKVDMALKLVGVDFPADANALEIGCSFGQMTALLAPRFRRLTAIDISPRSVEIAEKRLRAHGIDHVRFGVDDAETLAGFPDDSFDLAFSFSTIRFCPHPDLAMAATLRVVKPGGIAIVDFPNRRSPWHRLIKPAMGIAPHIHDRLFTAEEAETLFREAGFRVDAVRQFLFTSRRLPSILLPLFRVADAVGERIPPLARYAGIIMVKGVNR